MLGKTEGRKKRGHQMIRWLDGITNVMNMNLGKLWETVKDRRDWCAEVPGSRVGHDLATEQQQSQCCCQRYTVGGIKASFQNGDFIVQFHTSVSRVEIQVSRGTMELSIWTNST